MKSLEGKFSSFPKNFKLLNIKQSHGCPYSMLYPYVIFIYFFSENKIEYFVKNPFLKC